MGDLSAEPSMEDILSSIKRIIAEEGDGSAPGARRRPAPRSAEPVESPRDVLELSEPVAPAAPVAPVVAPATAPAAAAPIIAEAPVAPEAPAPAPRAYEPPAAPIPSRDDAILSAAAEQASRGALDHLSRLVVKGDQGNDGTLEGLVRELLRPMLREWLDSNLPAIVEAIVAREVERIATGR